MSEKGRSIGASKYGIKSVEHYPGTILDKVFWAKESVNNMRIVGLPDNSMFMVVTSVFRDSRLN